MTPATLPAFLAEDFDRILGPAPALLARCRALDGQRLYLSGATGFFGKSLLALLCRLQAQGLRFEVGGLSRNPQAFLAREPWAARLPWLTLHAGDAREPWPGHGRYDLLLHAATDTHAEAHRDPQAVFEGMLAATRQALAFAAGHGVRRLLQTGSGAQYGAMPPGMAGVAEEGPWSCDPTVPASAYGEAKRVSELLATLHAQRHGCAVVHTRCFAFVGPGLALDGHFAIGNFLRDALARQPLRLTSAGRAVRSYLYAADLAVWLLLLLLDAPGGCCVNVGSGEAVCVRDLARRVSDLVQPGLPVHTGPERPGEERAFYLPDIGRARALGLEVWTPLDQAICRTAQWHRDAAPGRTN